jgi:hypothetical protein
MLYLSVPPMRLPTDDATNKLFKWELFNQGYYVRLDLLQFEISEYQIIFPPYIYLLARKLIRKDQFLILSLLIYHVMRLENYWVLTIILSAKLWQTLTNICGRAWQLLRVLKRIGCFFYLILMRDIWVSNYFSTLHITQSHDHPMYR